MPASFVSRVEVEVERFQQERRNFRRRKSFYNKTTLVQNPSSSSNVVAETQQQCERLVLLAKLQCTQLIDFAKKEALLIADVAAEEASSIQEVSSDRTEQLRQLQTEIRSAESRLESLRTQLTTFEENVSNLHMPAHSVSRSKDAARKKAKYWKDREDYPLVGRKRKGPQAPTADESEEPPNRKRRTVDQVVAEVTRDLHIRLKSFNSAAKKSVLERFWLHNSMREYQPTALGCPKLDASVGAAMSDLARTLGIVKVARRKDHLATKRAVLIALTGQSVVGKRYQSSLANALGVKRQNLRRASKSRKLLDGDISMRYPGGERKIRSDRISSEVRHIVEKYWESNTRISPCAKDKARLRVGIKNYEVHQVHWLEDTEVEFFFKFEDWCKTEGNGVDIGLRSFTNLKPYYIRTMKDRNVCCCKYHVEMDLLKEAITKFRRHHHFDNCICQCHTCRPVVNESSLDSCVASRTCITSVRGWIEGAVCPKEEGQAWHKKTCILGHCKECGVDKLEWCPLELDPTQQLSIDWQTFEYIELEEKAQMKRQKKKGSDESLQKKVVRLRVVDKRTPMAAFKDHVLRTMQQFLVHNFKARWQADQHKMCLKTFPRGTIVSSIDFSENYTFKVQNEIQSMHWDNQQITLLIHVTYRHREDVEDIAEATVGRSIALAQNEGGSRDIIADYHFYISDDRCHDTLFVQHCMDKHWQWMKENGIKFNQHWVWSDGAASQFKACRPFYYVSRYYKRFGARMKWFFHASGHGKGVADALGGHVKSGLEKEQLKGNHGWRLENAHDAVAFCREKFALGQEKEYGDVQLVRRFFWEIGKSDVDRTKKWDCDRLPGCKSWHCFDGFSSRLSTLLQVRELCCFCAHCLDDEPTKCENVAWVGGYKLQMIKGVLPADIVPDVESMGVGEGGQAWKEGSLAELIQVGDFYAVQAMENNKWNVDFYILQCEEVLHSVKKTFTDGYDQLFLRGQWVVKGAWYQPVPGRLNSQKYVHNATAPPSYSNADHIIHIRFGLYPCAVGKGASRTFTINTDTVAAISASMK